MKLAALGVADEGGAIIVDEATGLPLPIAPKTFLDESDAADFVAYLGSPPGAIDVIRVEARRWPSTRKLPRCPVCNVGRCELLEALCESCMLEVERDRRLLDHKAEPGRNVVAEFIGDPADKRLNVTFTAQLAGFVDDDPYGNAGHDRAVCDCSGCENERAALASGGGVIR